MVQVICEFTILILLSSFTACLLPGSNFRTCSKSKRDTTFQFRHHVIAFVEHLSKKCAVFTEARQKCTISFYTSQTFKVYTARRCHHCFCLFVIVSFCSSKGWNNALSLSVTMYYVLWMFRKIVAVCMKGLWKSKILKHHVTDFSSSVCVWVITPTHLV